ncbi:Protein of unknown function [Bacillus cereus]|uniref:hypothetical protein n=1 Tax=Bacillus sp. 1663tsa1 TaxID=2953804 RepID=UPI0008645F36|nr:hypothetical protein [Bacillus sp. 1663tsa1]MCP1179833.1 hypothetical protein [Bacillus sp. 1663tsa1]SCM98818.1 Protein of unknown function [Bacillus cereus]
MKEIKRGTEPYFETLGGRNEIYIVVRHKDGIEHPFGEGFKTLKQGCSTINTLMIIQNG